MQQYKLDMSKLTALKTNSVLSHSSHVRLCVTPWTTACQPPLSPGFSGKNTGGGCCPPDPGFTIPCIAGFFTPKPPGKPSGTCRKTIRVKEQDKFIKYYVLKREIIEPRSYIKPTSWLSLYLSQFRRKVLPRSTLQKKTINKQTKY